MGYQLITSSHVYTLAGLDELPAKVQNDFDYVREQGDYSPRFVCYRGEWYDVNDSQRIEPDNGRAHPIGWAMRVHPGEPLARFDGVQTATFYSGVAFAFVDNDTVRCARFYS